MLIIAAISLSRQSGRVMGPEEINYHGDIYEKAMDIETLIAPMESFGMVITIGEREDG